MCVRVVLERWDTKGEYIDYHKDSRASWDIELDKSEGEFLVKMGCEDVFEVQKHKDTKKKNNNKKKSDDIRYYIHHPNEDAIMDFIRKGIKGMILPKDIARAPRLLRDHKIFLEKEGYRLPYRAFIKEFPEVKDLITIKAYNDWNNPNRRNYDNDDLYKKLEKELEMIL